MPYCVLHHSRLSITGPGAPLVGENLRKLHVRERSNLMVKGSLSVIVYRRGKLAARALSGDIVRLYCS